jgi:hypothetical protein
MKSTTTLLWCLGLGFVGAIVQQSAQARPLHGIQMLYQYNLRSDPLARRTSCQYCHSERNGGEGWNTFGSLVRQKFLGAADRKLNYALYMALSSNQDSDGDGFTDAQEVFSKTLPGSSQSKPAAIASDIQASLDLLGGVDKLFSPQAANAANEPQTPTATTTATTPNTAPTTTKLPNPALPIFPWASFGGDASVTKQNGIITTTMYSERPGDFSIEDINVANDLLNISYTLGRTNGSSYGGAGLYIATPPETGVDYSAYTQVRLRMRSEQATTVRVRIVGSDGATRYSGCYPVQMVNITDQMKTYTLDIKDFAPESYCGSRGKGIDETIKDVFGMEVTDIVLPDTGVKRNVLTLSAIEYLK